QAWQAKMKAANDQFQSNNAQYSDSLFNGDVTQSQGLGNLATNEAVSRLQSLPAQTALSVPNSSPDDVYWGADPTVQSDPFATDNSPSNGSNPDVYWGPTLDVTA